jgi:RNA polymerase sigma factor FliA
MNTQAPPIKNTDAVRNALISSHVEVARRISLRVARRCPDWIGREDLVSAGMLGLIEAAERYDATRTEPFLPFAEKRIRGAVLDELRRGDIMPRRSRQMARKISANIANLEKQTGESPSDEAVAALLEDSEDHPRMSSDATSPESNAAHSEMMAKVRAALPKLEKRDLTLLSLYYVEELTYAEVAQVLGVTTARICQLHGRAIARLRAEIS